MRMCDAQTASELLTALAGIKPDYRYQALLGMPVRLVREAADLQGVAYADTMGRPRAAKALLEAF
jgi:hypothetical protein